ncbi:MAG: protoporphyrinogen oxidase, partial [Chloroflexota bacterium]
TAPTAARPPSAFVSYKAGMERLVERLLEDLDGDLRLNTAVLSISRNFEGYDLTTSEGNLHATAVILAVPAYVAADIIRNLAPQSAEKLRQIRYVSTGTISLAYRRDEIGHPLDGFGIVIPRSERRRINAITWTSTKFKQRAPDEAVLLRVFFGGSRTPQMFDKADEELEAVVRDELREIMGITAEPLFRRIYRWPRANPQYDVDHLQRVDAIEAGLPLGILVSGSPYRGIGIPDCVHQAEQSSRSVFQFISEWRGSIPHSEFPIPTSDIRSPMSDHREQWLPLSAAAERLGVHPTTLRRWSDNGDITTMLTPGGHRRFMVSDLDKFAENRRRLMGRDQVAAEWADRALQTTRQEIVTRSDEPWLSSLDNGTRDSNRRLGQQLLGLTMQYISAPEDELPPLLDQASAIGRQYGEMAFENGLPLTEALEATLFFR